MTARSGRPTFVATSISQTKLPAGASPRANLQPNGAAKDPAYCCAIFHVMRPRAISRSRSRYATFFVVVHNASSSAFSAAAVEPPATPPTSGLPLPRRRGRRCSRVQSGVEQLTGDRRPHPVPAPSLLTLPDPRLEPMRHFLSRHVPPGVCTEDVDAVSLYRTCLALRNPLPYRAQTTPHLPQSAVGTEICGSGACISAGLKPRRPNARSRHTRARNARTAGSHAREVG